MAIDSIQLPFNRLCSLNAKVIVQCVQVHNSAHSWSVLLGIKSRLAFPNCPKYIASFSSDIKCQKSDIRGCGDDSRVKSI